MSNWKNLWLKEGFTTYFVYNLLSNTDPFLTEYEYYQNLINLLRKQVILFNIFFLQINKNL